ncbi:MAG: 4Fe-4S binding protein [Anaerolineae bacterium]|nr:4Fe-4S binding protein [Anaerolineae bacterium]
MVEEIWLPQIDKDICTGCGDCIVICPTNALALESGAAVVTDSSACNYCAECETICPVDAIALPYQIILESDL